MVQDFSHSYSTLQVKADSGYYYLHLDSCCGEFTRSEWQEDLSERGMSEEEVTETLNYLDRFCNSNVCDFFVADSFKKVRFSLSRGFHKSKRIRIVALVSTLQIKDYESGIISAFELVSDYISKDQRKRLERHFCGIDGCTCGSWHRANIEIEY